jgi:hypothetical protein
MLLELARHHATATQLRELDRLAALDALDEAQAERLAALIRATGADARVEALIARRAAEADRVRKRLPVPRPVKDALGELVVLTTRREC